MNQLRKQSTFYQKMAAQAKLSAYYTDQEHCQSIAELLEFPEEAEVCVLEPAIGDAEAVRTRYVFWNQQSVMQRLCVQ